MNRIAEIRKKRRLTQVELAKRLGIQQGTLLRYEHNKREPRTDVLMAMARILNCSLDELVGLKTGYEVIYSITLDNGRVINTLDRPDLWRDDDDFFEIEACTMPVPGDQRRYVQMWVSKAHIVTVNNRDWRADDDPA